MNSPATARVTDDPKRAFVLDTSVLMHDPTCLFRFDEHDIHIPMIVLEELDAGKKGMSESARNARQVSRFLDELLQGASKEEIDSGLDLPAGLRVNGDTTERGGRLFFQTRPAAAPEASHTLSGHIADNTILAIALALQAEQPGSMVALVSKDINLRIKATVLGVHAEDYYNDKTLDDLRRSVHRRRRTACKLLGEPCKRHGIMAGGRTDAVPGHRPGGRRLALPAISVLGGRQWIRGDGAVGGGRDGGNRNRR